MRSLNKVQISPPLGQPRGLRLQLQLQLLRAASYPATWPVSVPVALHLATVWHGCCRLLAWQVAVQALVLALVLVVVQLPRRGPAQRPRADPCPEGRGPCLVWQQLLPSVPGLQLWPTRSAQAPPPCPLLALELVLELAPQTPVVKDRHSQAASQLTDWGALKCGPKMACPVLSAKAALCCVPRPLCCAAMPCTNPRMLS